MRRVFLVAITMTTFGVIASWRLSGPAIAQGSCTLQSATLPLAFCDTFDAPAGTGNRSGDLESYRDHRRAVNVSAPLASP